MNAILQTAPGESKPEIVAAEQWFERCMARVRATGKFSEEVTLTPAMAQVLLARNDNNRPIVKSNVRRLAAALRRGDWETNGETLIVADTGELNDGQHRLSAVLETGISITTWIVFGPARESRKTAGFAQRREPAHILGMLGLPQAALASTALKLVLNLEAGVHLNTYRDGQEIERAYFAHPNIVAHSGAANRAARVYRQSTGLFVALHYLMAQKHPGRATEFFSMLADGTAPYKDHPVARLRQRLQANMAGKAKLPAVEVAAVAVKAWNAFVEGRSASLLRWTTGGDAPEAFPRIR